MLNCLQSLWCRTTAIFVADDCVDQQLGWASLSCGAAGSGTVVPSAWLVRGYSSWPVCCPADDLGSSTSCLHRDSGERVTPRPNPKLASHQSAHSIEQGTGFLMGIYLSQIPKDAEMGSQLFLKSATRLMKSRYQHMTITYPSLETIVRCHETIVRRHTF